MAITSYFASPENSMWIVWILLIIVVAFLIVFWAWKKGHIKQPKIPPQQPMQPTSPQGPAQQK